MELVTRKASHNFFVHENKVPTASEIFQALNLNYISFGA